MYYYVSIYMTGYIHDVPEIRTENWRVNTMVQNNGNSYMNISPEMLW
jgi:hypothetical protein